MEFSENASTVSKPFGVSVFGAAIIKASPDSASIEASVTRLETKPSDAFSQAKEGARSVVEFLRGNKVDEFGASQISLAEENRLVHDEWRRLGYRASVGFKVVVHTLDTLDQIVTGIIEAGANKITSITFRTSSLKELRIRARKMAIQSAKEKAEIYAEAAAVTLGPIVHIEDLSPEVLKRRFESYTVARDRVAQHGTSDEESGQILDPGAIEVGAAVTVIFSLKGSPL